ncbi:tetratricopeptide repeat protein, partial [Aggregatibacter kilianii]|uniref:tetratricopeptide repeat protein n=1 Tax=Aggregatibacter kilianii TaxID=2025884 RepID=UPI003CD0D22D
KQDYVEAAKWYRKAADKGYAMAQFNLGLMYRDGDGVKQNRTVAKEWLGKACDNGDKKGCLYYKKLK